ncbi:DUF1203 domain-containing protein [Stappia sp.]|uniref:DUF1203 domain-containing protein n=1 Tax=Stappia sp. TaxID=1870903 RepID=UPI003C7C00EB
MAALRFLALDTDTVRRYQAGGPDANGQTPERATSSGGGLPCRHCLRQIPEGAPYLILAHRPFPQAQPYAEIGPIFLCAEPCERHPDSDTLPEMFAGMDRLIMRGYGHDQRIVYGTGDLVDTSQIEARAEGLLARDDIAFVHLRSARNNCYQGRIERA